MFDMPAGKPARVAKLDRYREMRDFDATPEPAGERPTNEDGNRFVVQEHHARRLHWDFRLERDGVLVSWAVPKGLPADPKTNHLAVHTEDHPLDYIDFEGEIPRGSYGGGDVTIWDHGTYDLHKWEPKEVMVTLHGKRVRGKYVLFQRRGGDWMVHRMDPPQDPEREPMPETVVPMRARAGRLPEDESAYGFEILWQGVRAIALVEGGRARVHDSDGADLSERFPELRALGPAIGSRELVVDGVIVAPDDGGRPSAERLERRLGASKRAAKDISVVHMIFDVLYLDGHHTIALPYAERRALLDELGLAGPAWQTPAHHPGDGTTLLEAARAQSLPGVIAKRLDSAYQPGKTSRTWIEVRARPGRRAGGGATRT